MCVFLGQGAAARPLLKLRTAAIEGCTIPAELPTELAGANVTQTQQDDDEDELALKQALAASLLEAK